MKIWENIPISSLRLKNNLKKCLRPAFTDHLAVCGQHRSACLAKRMVNGELAETIVSSTPSQFQIRSRISTIFPRIIKFRLSQRRFRKPRLSLHLDFSIHGYAVRPAKCWSIVPAIYFPRSRGSRLRVHVHR